METYKGTREWQHAYDRAMKELRADGCPAYLIEEHAEYLANQECDFIVTETDECDIY